MMLNLAAVDPGGRTGLACATVPAPFREPPHLAVRRAIVEGRGESIQVIGLFNEQVITICEHLDEWALKSGHGRQQAYEVRNVLAVEGFRLHPKANLQDSALMPVRVGAKLEFYLWLMDKPWELTWHMPSDMQAVPDAALRRWNLWQPGKGKKDARAALKHLIVLARKMQEEHG